MIAPEKRAERAKQLTLAFDVTVAFVWAFIATLLTTRFDSIPGPLPQDALKAVLIAILFATIVLAVFTYRRIHHQVWRHMGWADAVAVAEAALIALSGFVCVFFGLAMFVPLPALSVLLLGPIWVILLLATRAIAIWRSTEAPWKLLRTTDPRAPQVLLVGALSDVSRTLRDPRQARSVRALGIIGIDDKHAGRAIEGVPLFGGPDALLDIIALMTARYGTPPRLALVGRGVAHRIPARLLAEAAEVGAIPMALTGRGQGEEALSALRPADLLLRPERVLDVRPVEDMLRQRRVMVTGAGGSIGQALVMASLRCQPAEIIAYDNSEYNLYALGMALEDGPVKVSHRLAIGDVRDEVRLAGVMQAHPPDIVLHAAALKHVPLVEDNASEAVLTNVRGVVNVAMAAARSGAQRFVLISSDKAVSPTNTMGATKRLAERVLAGLAQQKAGMAVSVVRFGNVLGSSGSVVPRFEAQIRAGGPVTVSHPDATRYFMTIGEAANLVLQAAAQNDRRDAEASLFMLDMGQPMRVLELAETMIRLAGKHPYTEVPIVFSGQRAGDRLHEAIVRPGETAQPTVVDGLNRVHGALEPIAPDDPDLLQLFASAEARDERALMAMLRTLVPGFEGRCGDA